MTALTIRPFGLSDVPELLELMKALAVFEDYIDDFAVSEADLVVHGLDPETPSFRAWVASENDTLVGMAVAYDIHWTYDRRPRIVLKELFVADHARGRGIGAELFKTVTAYAESMNASGLHWTVMTGNSRAEGFYRALGGQPDEKWNNWVWSADE